MKYHYRKEIGNGFDQNLSVSICKFIMYEYLISDLRIWMSFISQTRLHGLWFFDFYWEELFFLWKYSYIMRSLIKFSSETKKKNVFPFNMNEFLWNHRCWEHNSSRTFLLWVKWQVFTQKLFCLSKKYAPFVHVQKRYTNRNNNA